MTDSDITVKVDRSADALYVYLRTGRISRTREFGDWRNVDYDAEGQVVGVEIIGIAGTIDLRGIPEVRRVRAALEDCGFRDIQDSDRQLVITNGPWRAVGSPADIVFDFRARRRGASRLDAVSGIGRVTPSA